jgi:ribosomal protein L37AE/L43A
MGGRYPLSPSVFVQLDAPQAKVRAQAPTERTAIAQLFRCPNCGQEKFKMVANEQLLCEECATTYIQQSGIWDFKEAMPV